MVEELNIYGKVNEMATKKRKREFTKEDAFEAFQDIANRIDSVERSICDGIIFSKDDDNEYSLIIPDEKLLEEIKNAKLYEEVKPNTQTLSFLYDCTNSVMGIEKWNHMDENVLYSGDSVYLPMGERTLRFNKGLIPIRLRKSEFCEISYLIQLIPYPILIVKKYFPSKLEGFGVTLMKVFKIA